MVQIARLVNGLPVPDALQQLRFCNKKEYPLDKVIHNASNLMSIRYGLQPQDLVVKSISVGTAFRKKGLDIRGHGHMGLKIRSYSNVHVIVEEGKPKLSKYGEKRRAAKLEKQARIKREFEEKHEKTIEFLSSVCWENNPMIQGLERVDRGLQRAGLETRETEVGAVEDAPLLVAALPHQEDRQVAVLLALRAIRGHLEAVVAAIRLVARVRFRNEVQSPLRGNHRVLAATASEARQTAIIPGDALNHSLLHVNDGRQIGEEVVRVAQSRIQLGNGVRRNDLLSARIIGGHRQLHVYRRSGVGSDPFIHYAVNWGWRKDTVAVGVSSVFIDLRVEERALASIQGEAHVMLLPPKDILHPRRRNTLRKGHRHNEKKKSSKHDQSMMLPLKTNNAVWI